ncbi:Transcriptional regulator, TetR family [Alloactinosynnema sp. L-07]|uniref:TetR/AcrR family transcriptional regulator n=1 Tax=Alloactinosynnema sp. L-07 TaxID=1653480 RepID=UPI00065EFDC0|nr:TetR/AcrR family transcriptional regulator [Alloactinosynnema sp. L-07]CRK61464.1 Transcriptional regulator, TetR family [Alloactinosynnema sp. L-07]
MDARLAKGAETRRATLRRAVEIASVEGLEGLTIGRLAAELELSKSGIFAHFGSKEELQLAAIAFARDIFVETVVESALAADPGLPRLTKLVDNWLAHSRNRVFPGGCFFAGAAAEFDARQGRVHDAVERSFGSWMELLAQFAAAAVERGHLASDTDIDQLAFEIDALCRAANAVAVLTGDDDAYARAHRGIEARLRNSGGR